jgi:hypothetical protein
VLAASRGARYRPGRLQPVLHPAVAARAPVVPTNQL